MKHFVIFSVMCFVALTVLNASDRAKATLTPEQQTAAHVEEMKQKVARASERDICHQSAELVRNLVEEFNLQMNAGQLQPAQQTLNDIGAYSEKAQEASRKSHHKLKQAELLLHKSARRLYDIQQTLAVDNRPAVTAVIKRIEAADDELLKQVMKN